MDGMSGKGKGVLESLGDCTDLTFVGGSAGGDLKFTRTNVFEMASLRPASARWRCCTSRPDLT